MTYGVPVLCDVQIIPRGVSGLSEFDPFRPAFKSRIAGSRSPEEAATMRKMRATGSSLKEIANATGRSINTVFRATCHM